MTIVTPENINRKSLTVYQYSTTNSTATCTSHYNIPCAVYGVTVRCEKNPTKCATVPRTTVYSFDLVLVWVRWYKNIVVVVVVVVLQKVSHSRVRFGVPLVVQLFIWLNCWESNTSRQQWHELTTNEFSTVICYQSSKKHIGIILHSATQLLFVNIRWRETCEMQTSSLMFY